MKTKISCSIIITSILIVLSVSARAQASESEIAKEFYRADPNINLIINSLPSGWIFQEKDQCFIIYKSDSAIVLVENRINAPYETNNSRVERIKAQGIKVLPKLILRYEKKWDFIKIQEIQIKNSGLLAELVKLPEKYNITHLYDKNLSRKDNPVYTPKTENDKKILSSYYNEKAKLEKKMVKLPEFNSQLYSIFLQSAEGLEDDTHMVYPVETSMQLHSIIGLFREVCGK